MGECVVCEQQITNPLSPERLAEQMKTWLMESRPELVDGLDVKTDELLPYAHGEDFCVITGRKISVCPYCYTEHIFNWLRSIKLETNLLTEFLTYFHFDGAKLGYWQRAEALGLTP